MPFAEFFCEDIALLSPRGKKNNARSSSQVMGREDRQSKAPWPSKKPTAAEMMLQKTMVATKEAPTAKRLAKVEALSSYNLNLPTG